MAMAIAAGGAGNVESLASLAELSVPCGPPANQRTYITRTECDRLGSGISTV